ncbi:hypothetical protein PYCCODRAFT_1410918 [Trametes coccinea BRFM310]|uniref:Sister chromatid cohesion protein n=1 Tax=Trametes coccinea (strain BRFM310) TaxID=1353009 RepID=A0A1Y2IP84_TRAC3|nr:hypothetical protein PYCCODRAFT_1410918 [Trametes coccinea BRFM310]
MNGHPHYSYSNTPQSSSYDLTDAIPPTAAASDSVQDAHQLLAAYPFGSATPANHVARHLSNLSISAAPPSYTQPYASVPSNAPHHQPRFPQNTEYAREFAHILNPAPADPSRTYWESTRNQAVYHLAGQEPLYPDYQSASQWPPPPSRQSTYPTNSFAQSVINHTSPSTSYPTPPPPGIISSSSSLAGALGPPPPRPPRQTYQPQDSQAFFNNFLAQTPAQPPRPAPQRARPVQQAPQYAYHGFQSQPERSSSTHMQTFEQASPPESLRPHVMQQQPYIRSPPQVMQEALSSVSSPPLHQHVAYHAPVPSILLPQDVHQPPQSAQTPPSYQTPHLHQPQRTQQVEKPPRSSQSQHAHQPVQMHQPRQSQVFPDIGSPDPLVVAQPSPEAKLTPRKRKQEQYLESPTVKRVQMVDPNRPIPTERAQQTPQHRRIVEVVITTPPKPRSTPVLTAQNKKSSPYVEVPALPKAYNTPVSQRRVVPEVVITTTTMGKPRVKTMDDDDDLGGFGSDVDSSPMARRTNGVMASGKSSGRRDDRAPIEKLTTFLEDVFEAEDALPPDVEPRDLPAEWFSSLTAPGSQPQLHPNVIRKLITQITKVARPSKRHRINSRDANGAAAGTPRYRCRMADIDTATLTRILKMLQRSVQAGEELDPFKSSAVAASNTKGTKVKKPASGKKASAEGRRSKSQSPAGQGEDEGMDVDEPAVEQTVTEQDIDALTRTLEIARDSVLAADCCVALLGSDRLPKQLYSEELITACLATVKNQLSKILYPFVEVSPTDSHVSALLRQLIQLSSVADSVQRRLVNEIFQAISSVLPRINDLICADSMAMSETIIIQAVYIAIGPFFVVEAEGEGKSKKGSSGNSVISALGGSAMRSLRLDALSLIRSIFANHEDQRPWIIEEILSSLIKLSDTKQRAGQFRLRDGRSIRTVSALLMQLVQTSAHDVRVEAKAIRKAREQALALRRQDSYNEKTKERWLDEHDEEEIRLYASGLDSATKAAKTIVLFLTQRSGKTKATKNSNEAEYRAIFDNLISDLLAVLFWPEWPAASLILSIVCKFMVSLLDDIKSSAQNDNNAVKTLALDHLGIIAAHLRTSALKFKQDSDDSNLTPLDEIVNGLDTAKFEQLVTAHQELQSHLCKRSSEDQAFDSARELTAVMWGHELALVLQHCDDVLSGDEETESKVNRKNMKSLATKLKLAMRGIWDDASGDVFDIGTSQDEVARIDRLSEEIGTCQSLRNSFQPILTVVLQALDAPPVFMRTKALKALGQIVTSDPSILSAPNVRRGIETHLLDSSPAVRDAAVELIGKYMIDSPKFAADYYQKIADRIADTGLGVRKRVIKLLKAYYNVAKETSARIDICTRIVLRMLDEDDTVKDLAIKTMEELWFLNSTPASKAGSGGSQDKSDLLTKVAIIMGVAAQFKDRQSPLEDLLHRIMVDKDESDRAALHQRYVEVCETLIDGLVDASDLPGFSVLNCVQTIYLFTSAYPAVLSGSNAATLLPYLKNATTPEEQTTSDYLLRIFRASIPHMPKTAARFGQELQLALQPMILKPSTAAGVQGLQETVACMCATVHHITHDFARIVALLKSCNSRLQEAIRKPSSQSLSAAEQRTLSILLFITSLLCEHCNFDRLRTEQDKFKAEIDKISQGSVTEHVYMCLLKLYEKYNDGGLRGRILQCLGFLFRAQPALMTAEPSTKIMDSIFASPAEEARGRLLKILQDFLVSEAAKHTANEKAAAGSKGKSTSSKVNMEELIGNTDGFADSGVSSGVVQRYLDKILDAALSQNAPIQAAAVDILTFTIKQGLAHPLQSFPVIVALETSPNAHLSARASALHTILHSKHTSLLNARFVNSARTSFDYQKRVSSGTVKGYRMAPGPTAMLQRWYSLAREKRATRQDFLKALVKVFDVELGKSSQDDVDFTRYMAENFASFDYKTQEEPLTVIKSLTAILSTAGMQLVEMLSPSHLLTQLHGPNASQVPGVIAQPVGQDVPMQEAAESVDPAVPPEQQAAPAPPAFGMQDLGLMRSSVIIAMIMMLKLHLKTLYGISEEKCAKFVIGKKTAVGDRPAVRKHERPLSWERLPFATAPMLTSEDVAAQSTKFLEIWSEDGVTAEPEDDMIMT